ncbi:hyaluronidase-1 isoform X2 [Carlito syrichta]|uniref:Hyaluronidase n=1 Tax=Carlito syrichta TaxID=1868482 RepID=A0A3Q0DTE5_CARSF|nr:hyaluronidase-1 isoform X2 [Carlito syrichta]
MFNNNQSGGGVMTKELGPSALSRGQSLQPALSSPSPGQVALNPSRAMAAHLLHICILFLILLDMVQGSRDPLAPNQPFITVWNANTQWCLERHGVDVDVSVFNVVVNPGQTFRGPDMTIFYSSQLGTYPYYTPAGDPVFGGLPQNASLGAHLARTFQDILAAMPAPDFSGLVVIDWEAWRPRWAFNWDTKDIYRQRSRALVQAQHPDWPAPWVEAAAQDQFQRAARAWMAGTLQLGRALRPRGLWGFYGFPNCYNYDFLSPNYTGQCTPDIRAQNDKLGWLWDQSRALYPSIYVPAALEHTGKAWMYVRHRVGEAFRVAAAARDPNLLVLPYAQIFYDMTDHFLPLESCQAIKEYVDTALGPFILNMTSGALLCSQALCSGHGRCVRRSSHPEALLILNPASFSIQLTPGGGPLTLKGALSPEDRVQMAVEFKCRCYPGWQGAQCEQKSMW